MTGDLPEITVIRHDDATVFVYEGIPSGSALIASHCPNGATADSWGTPCPAGDSVAPGYEIDHFRQGPAASVWPDVFLRRERYPAEPVDDDPAEPADDRPPRRPNGWAMAYRLFRER